MDFWGTGHWIFMILIWVLIIAFVITLIWFLVKKGGESGRSFPESKKTAKDILDERYARGEIDDDEYRQKKKELREGENK